MNCYTQLLYRATHPRKWPINTNGDRICDEMLESRNQTVDDPSETIGHAPQDPKPRRSIVKSVIQIQQQKSAWFDKCHA